MKIFIEQHEVIINYYFKATVEAKQDDIIPHKKMVSGIYFYERQIVNEQEVFVKISLTKEMILEIADSIKNIENEIVEMPFDELPF